jgi:F0F1-type ATP synthase membrane subunit a
VALAVLVLNIPFGFWRHGTGRFTLPWFLAVHLPVPIVVTLRILSTLGWRFTTFPVLVASFFLGQFLGGKLHQWWK